MSRYAYLEQGQWEEPPHKGYKLACCDCGMVHRFEFRQTEGRGVAFRLWRDNRATAGVRRHMTPGQRRGIKLLEATQ